MLSKRVTLLASVDAAIGVVCVYGTDWVCCVMCDKSNTVQKHP
jgi:hypothetical protein